MKFLTNDVTIHRVYDFVLLIIWLCTRGGSNSLMLSCFLLNNEIKFSSNVTKLILCPLEDFSVIIQIKYTLLVIINVVRVVFTIIVIISSKCT